MTWLALSLNEWRRRPLRTTITVSGVALAVAAMFSLLAFHDGYRDGIRNELDRLGAHVLVVPKGCPYDAASMALHGANWPCYLTSTHFKEVQGIPGVASAAPALMMAPQSGQSSAAVYVGIDRNMLALRPGWKWDGDFPRAPAEILAGSQAAGTRGWKVGQRVPLPALAGREGIVSGILHSTGSSEDTFIFCRLPDAQEWFEKPESLTHMLIKLKEPNLADGTIVALRGCDAGMDMNVVPLTHLFRTIQAMVNSTRILLGCVALVGLLIAAAGVSNSVLMAVAERSREIGVMRAIGASRADIFRLLWLETVQQCAAGGLAGVAFAFFGARYVEAWLRSRLPYAPVDTLIRWDWTLAGLCIAGAVVLGGLAALLPAARAAELPPVEAMREGASS